MRFELNVGTDNAAFDGEDREEEVARILRDAADQVARSILVPNEPIRLFDVNGNRVGFAVLTEKGDVD